jgi:hypothetical protein
VISISDKCNASREAPGATAETATYGRGNRRVFRLESPDCDGGQKNLQVDLLTQMFRGSPTTPTQLD